jgi:hypothetical protein
VAGTGAGVLVFLVAVSRGWTPVAPLGLVLADLGARFRGQPAGGPLGESALKRRLWVVKDSGQLIPGHGGVMDRLDGSGRLRCSWAGSWPARRLCGIRRAAALMQIVTILGATGSVGRSAVDVLGHHTDRFKVGAVVGGTNAEALAQLAKSCGATFAALADESRGAELRSELSGSGIASGAGEGAVLEAVEREADIVFAAISGAAGLRPTHAALKPGRKLALANKETRGLRRRGFMADADADRRHDPAGRFGA